MVLNPINLGVVVISVLMAVASSYLLLKLNRSLPAGLGKTVSGLAMLVVNLILLGQLFHLVGAYLYLPTVFEIPEYVSYIFAFGIVLIAGKEILKIQKKGVKA